MRASYGITLFDQALLTRVAGVGRRDNTQVRLLSHRPRSRAAAQHLSRTIAYVGDILPNSDVRASPLVLASISHLLASSVIAAFPNTSDPEPQQGGADNRDGRPVTVRRALAFMESNLDQAISIADIAAAAGVTVRALQNAVRRHLGTTPLGQLRKLRLDEVRAELLAADPAVHTVAGVAARWGFHHPGRMTAAYRALYGELPSTTLSR
jgi:AraC-like DNA-binding protein